MIRNQDRSKWFGASDTSIIMGRWHTETFKKWWLTKLGFGAEHYTSIYMAVGNLMEIPIIHMIEEQEGRKIKLGKRPGRTSATDYGVREHCHQGLGER